MGERRFIAHVKTYDHCCKGIWIDAVITVLRDDPDAALAMFFQFCKKNVDGMVGLKNLKEYKVEFTIEMTDFYEGEFLKSGIESAETVLYLEEKFDLHGWIASGPVEFSDKFVF